MPTTYAIPNGRTVMDATTYTGNGGTITVNNSDNGTTGFKPDLIWCKDRTNALNNILMDSVRGGTQYLISNSNSAEGNGGTSTINSFNTNGFTAGNGTALNTNGDAFVGWQWQAGQGTTSTNTNGSVTSTVSVNATAGFSIVTWASPSSGAFTVGHGLGAVPAFIITKNRNTSGYNWGTYHQSIGNTGRVDLNTTSAITTTQNSAWNNTSPTSTVFSMGLDWAGAGFNYLAYCWTPIAGFSQFGSYTGNGSADGPFIYTGFRPKFILTKLTSGADQWYILDSSRDTYNVAGLDLAPNQSTAEVNDKPVIDFLSNGYKLRCTYGSYNGSGSTYIYAAFAENPFKYANAR